MKLTKVSYGETFNSGNFTSQRYDVEAEVEEGEHPLVVYQTLRDQVRQAYAARNERWEYSDELMPPGSVHRVSGPIEDDPPF